MNFAPDHHPIITDIVFVDVPAGSGWSFPLHRHPDCLELSFILEGSVDCHLDNMDKLLGPSDLLIKNAGVIHAEKASEDTCLREICISFDHVHAEGLEVNQLIEDGFLPVINTSEEPLIRELFVYLNTHRDRMSASFRTEMSRVLLSAAGNLIGEAAVSDGRENKNASETIRLVKAYLDEHFSERISLDFLSEKYYISPFYLTRQFKKVTGYTIKQYILDLQMGEAEKLLVFSDLPVKEIAQRCGYDSLQYFYVQFKKYAHCTPVEYRIRYRQKR